VSREIALDGSKAEEVEDKDKREIGRDAVWTLSTAKPGNGVEQLRCDVSQQPVSANVQCASFLEADKMCEHSLLRAGTTTRTRTGSPTGRSRIW
jgi:hypothetical protein